MFRLSSATTEWFWLLLFVLGGSGCHLFADSPAVSCDYVIWQVLQWLHCVTFRFIPVPPYDTIRFYFFLSASVHSLYSVFSCITLVFFDAFEVSALQYLIDPCYICSPFFLFCFVTVIDVWSGGPVPLMRVVNFHLGSFFFTSLPSVLTPSGSRMFRLCFPTLAVLLKLSMPSLGFRLVRTCRCCQ